MQTRTIHRNDADGNQETIREVVFDGDSYEFAVDLEAADTRTEDGHEYLGDGEVPTEVREELARFGAGAAVSRRDL